MEPLVARATLAALIEKDDKGKALEAALKRGSDQKNDLVALQIVLHELGFGKQLESLELRADGGYGDATVAAVAAFAKANASQAKGERVTLGLAKRILARYDSLDHLRRVENDVQNDGIGLYKKNHGDKDRVRSLQTLLNDLGASLTIDGAYGSLTKKVVNEKLTGKGDDGRPLTLNAAQALIDTLSPRYGPHWRKPGVIRLSTDKETPTPPGPPGYSSGPPKPIRKASPKRDFSTTIGITARLLGVSPVGQELENWCWAASTQMMIGYLRSLGETECPTCGRSGHHDDDITQARQMNRRLGDSEVDCSIERTSGFDYKTCDRGGWPYFFEFEDQIKSTEWASKRHVLEEHGLVLRDGGPRLRVRHKLSDRQLKELAYNSGAEFWNRLENAEGAALSWEMLTYLLDHQRPVSFAFRYPHPAAGHMRLAVGYAVTPGDKRWVAVADPLPPGTGEVHLIPYEYYRDGPFDGHWRDYWVPPAAEDGATAPPSRQYEEPTVGRELVASYITYPEDPEPVRPGTDGQRLSDEDSAAAFLEAKEGLRAVEAIALNAEPMAADLGMGAAWARASAELLAELGEEQAAHPPEFVIADLKPDDLELREKDFVPVYELTARELRDWNCGDTSSTGILCLLDRPREVIFAVTRPDQAPLRFFSAVTVRRKKDRWKLSSLGRASLTRFYLGKQVERLVERDIVSGTVGASAYMMLLYSAFKLSDEQSKIARRHYADFGIDRATVDKMSDRELVEHVHTWFEKNNEKRRAEGEKLSEHGANRRAGQLRELEASLEKNPSGYPGKAAEERYASETLWREAAEQDPDWVPREEVERWAELWAQFWRAVANKQERENLKRELQEFSPEKLDALLRNFYYPRGLGYLDGGYWRTRESLLDLVERQEALEELCAHWSTNLEDREVTLEQIFETRRDQEIEWLHRLSKSYPSARLELDRLEEERRVDQGDPRPKYLLSVPELYQLLVAYPPEHATAGADPHLKDEVFPVYQKTFHRPERCVKKGTLLEVLRDLQSVANDREVMRKR